MVEDKEKQAKMQEKYIELQTLDQQIKQIQQQSQVIENQIAELNNISKALEDLKKIKPGTETFFPISNGIFVKGNITDNSNVNVNVGSNIVVNKTTDQAKELIKKQLEGIKKLETQLNNDLQKLGTKAVELQKEISEVSSD